MQKAMQKVMQKINWAVLGCGHIAKTFMTSVQHVQNADVIACAASDESRAKSFAETHNIANYFGDYQSMLNERSVHVVYIATTHNFHFEHILLCLRHGKHVLCEKPLTLNAKQAKQAYALAQENNLLLVEAVWTRFLPAILALESILSKGEIGEVQALQANFSLNRDLPDSHRLHDPKLAGGALLDLGIYPITIADIVFARPPQKITSDLIRSSTGVDLNSFYTLHYDKGAVAQLSAGSKMSGPTFVNIMGDKGIINVPFFLGAKSFTVTLEGEEPVEHVYDYPEGGNFISEIQHVTESLLAQQTKSSLMPKDKTLRVLSIMDEIREQWGLVYPDEHTL